MFEGTDNKKLLLCYFTTVICGTFFHPFVKRWLEKRKISLRKMKDYND